MATLSKPCYLMVIKSNLPVTLPTLIPIPNAAMNLKAHA